jgi:ubiquinone/menaquinone biosynthesis C-methylase UbiE
MIAIDLGCGLSKKRGAVGVDQRKLENVDVVCNLDYTFPFKDESIDEVHSSHCIEHVEKPVEFMKEVRRVLRSNGAAVITAPLASHPNSFQADHKHFFRARDFYYYEKTNRCHYYVAEAGAFRIKSIIYEQGFPVYILPLWITGVIIKTILNLNYWRVREVYENYFLNFFPMKEFTVTLVKE